MMKKIIFLLALTWCAAAQDPIAPAPSEPTVPATKDEKDAIVNKHTEIRNNVKPPAENMQPMIVWADTNEVGCAKMLCSDKTSNPSGPDGEQPENQDKPTRDDTKQATQMACLYRPTGNVANDRPYKEKDAASKMMSSVGMLISAMLVIRCFE
uniref:SCP domain-containing protein n=1 Tax=Mesocestoides corti TaxID=53468 RepID=A0A5K3EZ45_MESCO